MTDFAHHVDDDPVPDEVFDAPEITLEEITEQAIIGHDILSELQGATSPTILAMMTEAKNSYVEAVKAIVEINPFESETEKARFIRVQSDARRYREMLHWLQKWIKPYEIYQERIRDDERIQQMRRESANGQRE